jgi:hypothetical protein
MCETNGGLWGTTLDDVPLLLSARHDKAAYDTKIGNRKKTDNIVDPGWTTTNERGIVLQRLGWLQSSIQFCSTLNHASNSLPQIASSHV